MTSKENILFESENYKVVVGSSALKDFSGPIYKVINKNHDVVEVESTVFPRVIDETLDLEAYTRNVLESVSAEAERRSNDETVDVTVN